MVLRAISNVSSHPQVQVRIPFVFMALSFIIAVPPFLLHVALHPFDYILSSTPLSKRINTLRSKFFFYIWRVMSPALDPSDRPIKLPLLRKAYGTVLEIGAGVGDNIKYYDRSRVERLIVVEPNTDMHPKLRAKANASGFFENDASLLLLGCGGAASDETALSRAGVGPASVDTVALIHVLCGIPGPASAIEMYRRILKSGGLLLFFEHVRSEQRLSADWQQWYTDMIWPHAFDGCCLNRPTGVWILGGPDADRPRALNTGKEMVNGVDEGVKRRWKDYEITAPDDQPEYSLMSHVKGFAVKA